MSWSQIRYCDGRRSIQESIPVRCVPPACQPYVLWWSRHRMSVLWGVQCIMCNDHTGTPRPPHVGRQTRMKTLPSHNFVCGRYISSDRILTMEYSGNLRRISSMLWYMSVPLFAWTDNILRTSSILPWSKNLYICNTTVYSVYLRPLSLKATSILRSFWIYIYQ